MDKTARPPDELTSESGAAGISATRLAELLAAPRDRYRSILEGIPVIAYVDDLAGGAASYVSPQVQEVLGYAPRDWVGDPGFRARKTHPRDRDRVAGLRREASEAGLAFDAEYRMLASDGRAVWLHDRSLPVKDEHGRMVSVQGVMVDVTERRRAGVSRDRGADVLLESEQHFRQLFAASPDAIVLIDPHDPAVSWPILDCNEAACRMNGHAREELIGQSIDTLNLTTGTPEERPLTSSACGGRV